MYHEIYHSYLPYIGQKLSVHQLTVLHCATAIFTVFYFIFYSMYNV